MNKLFAIKVCFAVHLLAFGMNRLLQYVNICYPPSSNC